MQSGYLRALLAKSEIAEYIHLDVLAILRFLIIASAISLNGNRRQPPPCLPKAKQTDAVNGGEAVHLDH